MKTANYILLLAILLSSNLVLSHEEIESKFNTVTYLGIGYSIVENDNEPS